VFGGSLLSAIDLFLVIVVLWLQALHSETFEYVTNLRVLSLAGNNIKFLYDKAFHGLSHLLSLSLAHNHLNYLPENVFSPLAENRFRFRFRSLRCGTISLGDLCLEFGIWLLRNVVCTILLLFLFYFLLI